MDSLTAARADVVIDALSRLWPKTFFVFERRRRPLAIGIDVKVIEQLQPMIDAGVVGLPDIRAALRRYVGAIGYLQNAAIINNPRLGLDGRPAGAVTRRQALHARARIRQRRERRAARTTETVNDAAA